MERRPTDQVVELKDMKIASVHNKLHILEKTGTVTIWDMTLGFQLRALKFEDNVIALVVVADELVAIALSFIKAIQVWNYETGLKVFQMETDRKVTCMTVLSNEYLAIGYVGKRGDAMIKIHPTWKLSVFLLRFPMIVHIDNSSLVFIGNSRSLVELCAIAIGQKVTTSQMNRLKRLIPPELSSLCYTFMNR